MRYSSQQPPFSTVYLYAKAPPGVPSFPFSPTYSLPLSHSRISHLQLAHALPKLLLVATELLWWCPTMAGPHPTPPPQRADCAALNIFQA